MRVAAALFLAEVDRGVARIAVINPIANLGVFDVDRTRLFIDASDWIIVRSTLK